VLHRSNRYLAAFMSVVLLLLPVAAVGGSVAADDGAGIDLLANPPSPDKSAGQGDGEAASEWVEGDLEASSVEPGEEGPAPGATTEALDLIGAASWHDDGYRGAGVKVGVLSTGFGGYEGLLGTELPDTVTTHWADSIGGPGSTTPGTAAAEVVCDVAPDADLYLANFSTHAEWDAAIDWFVSEGVDVAVETGGFTGGPVDGTSSYARKLDAAHDDGLLFCQAAGELGQRHWSGPFQDINGNDYLDFVAGTDEGNDLYAMEGSSIRLSLWWDDPWGGSSNDYDLCLFDDTWGTELASSESRQNGNDNPLESLSFTAGYTGWYKVAVRSYDSDRSATFDLASYRHNLQHRIPAGSLLVPGDSTTALTVGAVPWSNPDELESFSSRGPTGDGRVKPDLVAPDGVTTSLGVYTNTTCAAAHVAGAAALVLCRYTDWSIDEAQWFLEATAVDLGATGKDNEFGSGRVHLPEDAPDASDFVYLSLKTGWNMVSVPVEADDMSVDSVFPDVEAVYTWNPETKSYVMPDTIDCTLGYWVAVTSDRSFFVEGEPAEDGAWPVALGWNMIGSTYRSSVDYSDPSTDPPGNVEDFVYWWNPSTKSYAFMRSLDCGKGHWAAATGDCDLAVTPEAVAALMHKEAWSTASEECEDSEYYRNSLYSTRTLAVANPEVYLQADTLWMDMISSYAGWQANYLQRDRETPSGGWWDEIGGPINDGFMYETSDGSFDWDAVEWVSHRNGAIDLFAYYGDAPRFDWLDNRLPFIWSALKGEGWAMPYLSLAELMYLDMLRQDMSPYLLVSEERDGFVALVSDTTVTLYDPVTGGEIAEPGGDIVLVMNNEHVWYPLMDRDDTGEDAGLSLVVAECCDPGATPYLSDDEEELIDDLAGGTALESAEDFAWARLFAARATNQCTWRATPLRELSAVVFPERYAEDDGFSDTPYEQSVLGMVVTEMGSRLSPACSEWAAGVKARSADMDVAFRYLGGDYLARFHREDEDSDWVYGDYYHCWLPNVDDKLLSGLGDCVVEAGNTMAALSLADVPDWDVLYTNWWRLDGSGGHVICGAYTDAEARSLSNGLFNTNDGVCRHGPLWNINGTVAEEVVYDPSDGFMAFVQTENAASFSPFLSPFTNLSYGGGADFLEDLEDLEPATLIVEEYGSSTGMPIDDYIDGLPDMEEDWPDNVFEWEWT